MPKPSYIKLEIDGIVADIDPEGQVPTVSYALEDENDFEQKKSAESLDIEMPGTLINDQIHNTIHNPSVRDTTPDGSKDNFKPLRYIANGQEILIGKYLMQSVIKRNGRPEKYKGKAYGLNGDWVIDLKEKTLLDFINPRPHLFDIPAITGSWSFDGLSEVADYVYAPARYRSPFHPIPDDDDPIEADDVLINDLKPSISIYWILWRGFKSVGYRIVSTFMDTAYYRRSVLPWTWGGFDYIDDTRWAPLKFLAIGHGGFRPPGSDFDGYLGPLDDLGYITIDGNLEPGAYENTAGLFQYYGGTAAIPYMGVWRYLPSQDIGKIVVNFSTRWKMSVGISNGDVLRFEAHWYKNGVLIEQQVIIDLSVGIGFRNDSSNVELFFETEVVAGDYIGLRVFCHFGTSFAGGNGTTRLEEFRLNFVRLGKGSTIDLTKYPKFKNYNWLDLLRGEIDCFDLMIGTDPIRKEVYIEPAHAYDINGTLYPGYYDRNQLDWSEKVDLSKETELELFSDYERELIFKFRDDPNDGGLKKIQDRNQTTIGMAKYVLPERFKSEKKEKENRFYSPVMHRDNPRFKHITGIAPQLITIVPENIANTSNDASENIYNPKRAWYKGVVTGYGGWRFEGVNYTQLPFMFAVNYKPGGETDPVFSYADQFISGQIAKGWMKKFFLQRLAIIRNGRRFTPIHIMLNNYDVANFLHRESIIIENIEYILTSIQQYDPISSDSTPCRMWMFLPMSEVDKANSFPSVESIQNGISTSDFEVKYWQHILLAGDVIQ